MSAATPYASLVTRITRSVRWAFLESVLSAAASLGSVLVLARLLGPAEFGLAGLAVAVWAIVHSAALAGMPDALVRAPSAHTRLTDAAFWATLAIGVACAVLTGAIGLAVAVWGDPRLGALIAVQGLANIAIGAATAPTGMLLRKMRTRAMVNRTAISKLAGLATSVALAVAGAGAWAIVIGNLALQLVAAAQLLATMRRPAWRWRDPLLLATIKVGILSGAQQTIGTLSTRGFILAFGAVYGAYAVGLFNFALRLVEESCGLVITTLRRVTVTSFAAARREGLDLKPLFVRGTNAIAWATAPLFLGGAAVAPDAVALLFGSQWSSAVPALQLMLCMWVVRATRMLVNAIMLVEGRQATMVRYALAGLALTALAFVASLPFGADWTVLAYAVTLVGAIFGGTAFARATGLGAGTQLRAPLVPILLALAMWAAVTALRLGPLATWPPAWRLPTEIAGGIVVFSTLALTFDRTGLKQMAKLLIRK